MRNTRENKRTYKKKKSNPINDTTPEERKRNRGKS